MSTTIRLTPRSVGCRTATLFGPRTLRVALGGAAILWVGPIMFAAFCALRAMETL